MASVWRGHDQVLDRPVAVKRLHSGLGADNDSADRFRREADTLARLNHPNLVRLFDRGEDDRGPWLVMELVEGETLRDHLRRTGPMAPVAAASLCAQVAEGLSEAHAAGIVHRDIKARNVLLGEGGIVKLADFGVARLVEAGLGEGLTSTGSLVGSGDYIAPEAARGELVGPAADIYSLGIVLYECLTGRVPYAADSWVAVAMCHVNEPLPDPRDLSPAIPEDLVALLRRATAKDPAQRYADGGQMATALRVRDSPQETMVLPSLTSELSPGPAPTPARPRSRIGGALLLIGALSLAAGGVALITNGDLPGLDGSASAADLRPGTVSAYDPEGNDGIEGDDIVPLASDGDPATAWFTSTYASVNLGGLKSGVGLLVSFGEPVRASRLRIESPLPGARIELRGPRAADGTRPALAEGQTGSGPVEFRVSAHEPATEYVLWVTELVEDPEATGANRFRAAIAEFSLSGDLTP
jgi:serine/threonine-protein kinase